MSNLQISEAQYGRISFAQRDQTLPNRPEQRLGGVETWRGTETTETGGRWNYRLEWIQRAVDVDTIACNGLADWLTDMSGWLTDWLTGWLTDRSVQVMLNWNADDAGRTTVPMDKVIAVLEQFITKLSQKDSAPEADPPKGRPATKK